MPQLGIYVKDILKLKVFENNNLQLLFWGSFEAPPKNESLMLLFDILFQLISSDTSQLSLLQMMPSR